MPVDASIYDTRQPAPVNPLQMLGQYGSAMSAINQNRLFNQQYNSNLGISQIFRDAIGPDGKVDTARLEQLLKDPKSGANVTLGLPEALGRAQTMQQQQLGIDSTRLDLAQKSLKTSNDAISSLLQMENPTQKDVIGKLGELLSAGAITPQLATSEIANMPPDGQLKPWLQQHLIQNMDSQSRLQALYGTPQAVNTGGQTQIIAPSSLGGVRQLGTLQNTLDPATASAPTPVLNRNPDGSLSPSTITRQQFQQAAQQGPVATAPALTPSGLTPGEAAQQVPTFQNGQPGTVPLGAIAGGGRGAPAAPGAAVTPGINPTGPRLGQAAAADVNATESAKQGVELQRTADGVPARKGLLNNLDAALNQFTSGPGQDWKRVAKAFTNANNPFGNAFDAKSIASQEEFNKQAVQLAQQQFQALGGTGTDSKLDSAMHTSPNDALSNMGNRNIIALLKGNEDAIAVKNREWQAYQKAHGPESYGEFSTQFNQTYDPRVFQMQYMTPSQRGEAMKAMSPPEVQALQKAYSDARTQGWIKPWSTK